jgi:hypothetical protein
VERKRQHTQEHSVCAEASLLRQQVKLARMMAHRRYRCARIHVTGFIPAG